MASWSSAVTKRIGNFAFGMATPAGAVPVTGSATFQGKVAGMTDILVYDYLYGGYGSLSVDGTVQLNFDFAGGKLSGSMALFIPDGMQPFKIGDFAFKDTVFGAGSTTYSGKFESASAGQNFFLGQFTGPAAQETIGTWAVPFLFNKSADFTLADGQVHQATGAWIGKR
jgi:hypothetical protein